MQDRDVTDQDSEQPADLEYDLAHEAVLGAAAGDPPSAQEHPPSVYVATRTEGYDGDYGYDLAHDVPGR